MKKTDESIFCFVDALSLTHQAQVSHKQLTRDIITRNDWTILSLRHVSFNYAIGLLTETIKIKNLNYSK